MRPPELACAVCGEALEPDSDTAMEARGTRPDCHGLLCGQCLGAPRFFSLAAAHGDYEGDLRELIRMLKFYGVRSCAVPLGRLAADAAIARFGRNRDALLTAVPLHHDRRRQRRFNQAELIARAAARRLKQSGWKVEENYELLLRQRTTDSQYTLNATQRRANLRGAFVSGPGAAAVAGRQVLLVDDIMTTGATASLCASSLLDAGATIVLVATVARAQPPVSAPWNPQLDNDASGDWPEFLAPAPRPSFARPTFTQAGGTL